jgi:hypothetical protein
MRRLLMLHMLAIGFMIQAASYFLMASPWGFPPSSPVHSDPRVPFAPLYFIGGILVVFLGVLFYELLPDEESG